MTNPKRYQILDSLPAYGAMYIPVTTDGDVLYSEGVVIRLFRSDGTDWVANFQPGWTNTVDVVEFKETDNILVNAQGICYIMNPDQTDPIAALE